MIIVLKFGKSSVIISVSTKTHYYQTDTVFLPQFYECFFGVICMFYMTQSRVVNLNSTGPEVLFKSISNSD